MHILRGIEVGVVSCLVLWKGNIQDILALFILCNQFRSTNGLHRNIDRRSKFSCVWLGSMNFTIARGLEQPRHRCLLQNRYLFHLLTYCLVASQFFVWDTQADFSICNVSPLRRILSRARSVISIKSLFECKLIG